MNEILRALGLLLIVLFLSKVVLVPLVQAIKKKKNIRRVGKRANGVIIAATQKEDEDKKIQFAPVIRFISSDNKEVTFESDDFQFKEPKIGKTVKILYDPANPQNAVLDNNTNIIFGIVFAVFLLLVVFFIGLAIVKSS